MLVVAFTGRKHHGKDQAALALMKLHEGEFKLINFADPVKAVSGMVFGLTHDEMTVPELKEKRLDRWPHESPRSIMQKVGTDAFRTVWPDVWVKHWEMKANKEERVVVSDLRFLNEFYMIKHYWGTVVRIVRSGMDDSDHHRSETELSSFSEDILIENDGSLEDLYEKVAKKIDIAEVFK